MTTKIKDRKSAAIPDPLPMPEQSPLIDRDIIELVGRHGIIEPFEIEMLSGCSYDLRVGKEVRSRHRKKKFELSDDKDEFFIESGECVTFQTMEELNFREPPPFGFVVNKHTVLARGIVHPITKVDPGFKGSLAVTIFNHGGPAEKLKLGQPIVSLIIFPLESVPDRLYGQTQKPTAREGATEIATVVDEPSGPLDDAGLQRMYGTPLWRLYDRVNELEKIVHRLDK
jgi:deoxycytidine triphosphate deaminase